MRVITGLERIREYSDLFRGKKIGLITNFTGVLPDFSMDTIDVFASQGWLPVKIFTPEHGLYGAGAGESVDDSMHPRYHIPVLSLYGDHRTPTPEDLSGIDVLVYDIQDVGLRYYTYIYTMCYALDAAARQGIRFVVLDRPNPLGENIAGPRIDDVLHDFVGDYALPLRYGLTPGEIALYYAKRAGITDELLQIIPLAGYDPAAFYPQTSLLWNVPSPAIPTFESALCYSGGCLFEPLHVSEGRSTGKPFQMYGAPYMDMDVLYEKMMDALSIEMPYTANECGSSHFQGHTMLATGVINKWGLAIRKRSFTPSASDFAGQLCYGLELLPVSAGADTLSIALLLIKVMYTLYGDILFEKQTENPAETARDHLALLYGTKDIHAFLAGSLTLSDLHRTWHADADAFRKETADLRLYTAGNR